MNYQNKHPQLRKEISLFQNDLLLLFLKYKLACQFNIPEGAGILNHFINKKSFLVHCILHAVFGNKTQKDPVIQIDLAQSVDNKYWLEIESSGAPEIFFSNLEAYSKENGIVDYFLSPESELHYNFSREFVEIGPAKRMEGSRIRVLLA